MPSSASSPATRSFQPPHSHFLRATQSCSMNYSAMGTTNTSIPPPAIKTTLPHTSTSPESGLSPPLPIEIVESILPHVPHRFPLRKIEPSVFSNDSPAMHDQMHTDCISALNVVVLAFQFFIPRLPNCLHNIVAHKKRFSAGYLPRLLESECGGYAQDVFQVAVQLSLTDVSARLWVNVAKLQVPSYYRYHHWAKRPAQLAMQAKAWNSLDWLSRGMHSNVCCEALTYQELAQLVRTGGQRQLQLVALWLRSWFGVLDSIKEVIEAACEMGVGRTTSRILIDGFDILTA